MVNLEDLPVDAAISWTEQVLLNDSWVAKLSAINSILAKQHNHTASDITNFNTAVDARIDVPTDTAKTTPVDTDVFALWDTIRKKVTRANIKATLKTYFDTLYHTKNALRTGLTANKSLITDWSGNEGYTDPAIMASDAEATAWTIENKYINPKQLKNWSWYTVVPEAGTTLAGLVNNLQSANTSRINTSLTYIKVKEIAAAIAWTYTVYFEIKADVSTTAFGRIYVDWVAVWTERSTTSTSYTWFLENITVTAGQLIQLYYKKTGTNWHYAEDFRLYWFIKPVSLVLTVNTD